MLRLEIVKELGNTVCFCDSSASRDDEASFFNPAYFNLDHVASVEDLKGEEVQSDVRDLSIPTKQPFLIQLLIQCNLETIMSLRVGWTCCLGLASALYFVGVKSFCCSNRHLQML